MSTEGFQYTPYTQGRSRILSMVYPEVAAASTDAILAGTPAGEGDVEHVLLPDAQPDAPRLLTATVAASTAGDVAAVSVVVEGFDYHGNVLTETLPAFTEDTAGSVTGTKAFARVTRITSPAHDGDSPVVSVGVANTLGLPTTFPLDTIVATFRNGVKLTSGTSFTRDADEVSANVVALSGAGVPNGTEIQVHYYK